MNISALSSLNKIVNNYTKNTAISFKSNFPNDSFEKTTTETKSVSIEQWLKETDFLNTQVFDILSNPKNKLGQGFSHTVYSIPNNEDYVIRVNNGFDINNIKNGKPKLLIPKDIGLKVNIGRTLATAVYENTDSENPAPMGVIEILQKQKGFSIGVPPIQALVIEGTNEFKNENEPPYNDISRQNHYAKSMEALAKLPVESYEKLIKDLKEVTDYRISYDHLNSNNFLLDEDSQSIGIIDTGDYACTFNLGNVLYALTNTVYHSTYIGANPYTTPEGEKALDNTMQIIDKFFQAMKNTGYKINKYQITPEFQNFLYGVPFTIYIDSTKYLNYDEKIQKLKDIGIME